MVPDIKLYNAFGGTLNLALSIYLVTSVCVVASSMCV